MSAILTEAGYTVRLAEDGFSALRGIHHEIPDILLSDLNMPGMTGFELLSVVRIKFPTIRTVAMSGAYSGNEVPDGIAANAFYPKGSDVDTLLRILDTLSRTELHASMASSSMAPLWIHRSKNEFSLEESVTIACPECLRTFSQPLQGALDRTQAAKCVYCNCQIYFAIVIDGPSLAAMHSSSAETKSASKVLPQYYY